MSSTFRKQGWRDQLDITNDTNSLESDITALNSSIISLSCPRCTAGARLHASDCVIDNVRRAGSLMNLQPLITGMHSRALRT